MVNTTARCGITAQLKANMIRCGKRKAKVYFLAFKVLRAMNKKDNQNELYSMLKIVTVGLKTKIKYYG